jgi:hypothetical protein
VGGPRKNAVGGAGPAQKKSGLVMHPPGNPAEPERIVKALSWIF